MRYVENICEEEKLWTSTNQSNGPMQGLNAGQMGIPPAWLSCDYISIVRVFWRLLLFGYFL